jgi:phosphoesterase RecJ-like protein
MTVPSRALDHEQEQALELLRSGSRFLLVGHVRPDGDCIGGQAALERGLTRAGKQVTILNTDPLSETFDYLGRHVAFSVYRGGALPEHDVCVLLDFNDLSRCGPFAEPIARAKSKKLVIDHHPHQGEAWWDARFVDVHAAATGLLVHRILQHLEIELDRVAATAVFTSLVTDTGWFRYSNTDAESLALASELVGRGVDPSELFRALFQRRPLEEPRALATVLGRLEYFADGRLAVVDQPLTASPGLEDGDPVLDILRAVGAVEVVLYLREVEPGVCKLSARSKTGFDVNVLARRFGGGGHVKAAGATIAGRIPEVKQRLVAAALELMNASAQGMRAR